MRQMAEYFTQLESHQDLEENIIRDTKINKVLKGIIKLDSIPKEEVYNFKKRSADLLNAWDKTKSGDAKADGVNVKEEGNAEAKSGETTTEETPKDVDMKDADLPVVTRNRAA